MKKMKPKKVLRHLLDELRIDQKCLEVMANGYSPNIQGTMDFGKKEAENYYFPNPVVQLSANTAQSIIDLNIDWND